jgi:hypothetical protein
MAINFPNNPAVNDTFTVGSVVYKWDGTSWNGEVPATGSSIPENAIIKTVTIDSDSNSISAGDIVIINENQNKVSTNPINNDFALVDFNIESYTRTGTNTSDDNTVAVSDTVIIGIEFNGGTAHRIFRSIVNHSAKTIESTEIHSRTSSSILHSSRLIKTNVDGVLLAIGKNSSGTTNDQPVIMVISLNPSNNYSFVSLSAFAPIVTIAQAGQLVSLAFHETENRGIVGYRTGSGTSAINSFAISGGTISYGTAVSLSTTSGNVPLLAPIKENFFISFGSTTSMRRLIKLESNTNLTTNFHTLTTNTTFSVRFIQPSQNKIYIRNPIIGDNLDVYSVNYTNLTISFIETLTSNIPLVANILNERFFYTGLESRNSTTGRANIQLTDTITYRKTIHSAFNKNLFIESNIGGNPARLTAYLDSDLNITKYVTVCNLSVAGRAYRETENYNFFFGQETALQGYVIKLSNYENAIKFSKAIALNSGIANNVIDVAIL